MRSCSWSTAGSTTRSRAQGGTERAGRDLGISVTSDQSQRIERAHHTGIWFVDEKTQAASVLKCGASPKDEKAAVVKAGGLLAFHHPEYTYIEDAEKHKDKTPSATALKYTLPKDQAEPFDMIEVWNKGGFTSGNVENVLKWTERNFYDRGLFPAVISGMDDHGPDHKAIAFTMIDSNGGTDRDAIKACKRANVG
jgi:hypothetical protein